ncbi:AbrB/MazE/SpoVT family DNA-binding domain-containing protein [Amycolatopsis sp. NPDC058278]|uniref:AbrB/MazE/SpoVT family DNA-binding domain-containing protein n=1 Tax=Amycolatopsis sp. NPDC058278 TaxID=3346417 RepID=UPI0036DEDF6E
MHDLVGPRRISQVNQVAIPVKLLRALGLSPGDSVYFELHDTTRGELTLVAEREVHRRYSGGNDEPHPGAPSGDTSRLRDRPSTRTREEGNTDVE